jgi:hypothetical protein
MMPGGSGLLCSGCLVRHRDGSVAYCSRELDGHRCTGPDRPHLGGVLGCRVTAKAAPCRYCTRDLLRRLVVAPLFVPAHDLEDVVVTNN